MSGVEFDLSELNKLSVDIPASAKKGMSTLAAGAAKVRENIKRDAKAFAPVDTGNMRNSITSETTQTANAVEIVVGPTANYAPYVEFGTSRNAPAAFMGPALDRNAPDFVEIVGMVGEMFSD